MPSFCTFEWNFPISKVPLGAASLVVIVALGKESVLPEFGAATGDLQSLSSYVSRSRSNCCSSAEEEIYLNGFENIFVLFFSYSQNDPPNLAIVQEI